MSAVYVLLGRVITE